MRPTSLRTVAGGALRRLAYRLSRPFSEGELAASAMVFAPHQDDETLGCGGTILRKRGRGAEVHIAFMTDGSTSHARWMPGPELAKLRAEEARAAAARLGVDPRTRVHFLDLPDGALAEHEAAAVTRVVALLDAHCPAQVFLPYRRDPQPDHLATHRAVLQALHQTGQRPTLFEYPIWFWRHWPWTPLGDERGGVVSPRRNSLDMAFGFRLLGEFRRSVAIGDLLEAKKEALEAHRSQVTGLPGYERWPVLAEVSEGAFLACFFAERELFSERRS